jgi:hypothetical protein
MMISDLKKKAQCTIVFPKKFQFLEKNFFYKVFSDALFLKYSF